MAALERYKWWLFRPAVGQPWVEIEGFDIWNPDHFIESIVPRSRELTKTEFLGELFEKGLMVKGLFGDREWPPKRFDN
jgi:hypothetical protein